MSIERVSNDKAMLVLTNGGVTLFHASALLEMLESHLLPNDKVKRSDYINRLIDAACVLIPAINNDTKRVLYAYLDGSALS